MTENTAKDSTNESKSNYLKIGDIVYFKTKVRLNDTRNNEFQNISGVLRGNK